MSRPRQGRPRQGRPGRAGLARCDTGPVAAFCGDGRVAWPVHCQADVFDIRTLAFVASLALLGSMASGCLYGGRNYSHVARSITSPIRSTPIKHTGEIDANVTIHDVQTSSEAPTANDAALLVPELSFGIGGRAGFISGFHIGGHVDLAFTAHTGPTYDTTTQPDRGPHMVLSGGPDVGITRPFGESDFSWGVFGSLTASIGSRFLEEGDGTVVDVSSLMGFYRLGLAVHWSPRREMTWEVGLTVQNYAFGDFNGALDLDRHGLVPYAGLRVVADAGLYGYAQLHFPVGFEYTNASPVAGVLGLGWSLGEHPVGY